MTVDPAPEAQGDLASRADVDALLREVPAIVDARDLSDDTVFESDDEVDDFLRFVRETREADLV